MRSDIFSRKTMVIAIAAFLTAGFFLTAVLVNRSPERARKKYERYLRETAAISIGKSGKEPGKEKEADSPDMAALQEFFMTADPAEKRVPAERLIEANRILQKLSRTRAGGYQLQWSGTSSEMGGRTRAIMWDPNAENKAWAGGVTGGLWYNNNVTSPLSQWSPVNDFWSSLSISCITYDPANTQVFYAGTGEVQTALITYRESSGRGVGIWKSADGGATWELLPSTSNFAYITKIAVRNENGTGVIYAGVSSGYYHGANQQSLPSDGLYRSADGGSTWQQVLPLIPGSDVPYAVSDIAVTPSGRIFVGTMQNLNDAGGACILSSDNGTVGSWIVYDDISNLIIAQPQYKKPGRVMLAPAPSNGDIVYAAIGAGYLNANGHPVYYGRYIIKTTDGGATWDQLNKPTTSGDWANLAWHALTITVDPNNPETIYTGGLDVWRSTNSGTNWQHLSDWAMMYYGGGDTYVHADQHIMVYKPGSSSTALFGSDGGIFFTSNANGSPPVFQQKNSNYNTLQFYTCAIHPTAGTDQYIGGLQDNGTLLYNGSPLSISNMIDGGDGAFCFWDQDQPNLYLTSYYYNRYTVFQNGTWVSNIDNQSGVFVNPADYQNNNNLLIANAVDFVGTHANQVLRVPDIPQNGNGVFVDVGTFCEGYFSHVKISPFSNESSTTLFLGTVSGRLFKVNNAQAVPQTTEIGSPEFPASNISCIAIGGSEDTLLVTFSNYGVSSIWQTYDGGEQWNEVEGNLPDMPVRWAIYHPQNSRQALIATELGVWSTSNLHDAQVYWQPQTTGMANVRVDMLTLRTSDNTVLAASHGRGLFRAEFPLDLNTAINSAESQDIKIYTDGSGGKLTIETKNSLGKHGEISLFTLGGKKVMDQDFTVSALHSFSTGPLVPGVYLVKVVTDNRIYCRKLFIR
ncbi:MAG TPA: T9SS type A sorting domain-containing protein [Bacteroidales bacterium]|nr:T9SS type A sorting domain-containing protein [Bacteroidales bacterium]HPT01579.1 T9SS type A sorting domain-containing protein [Bacteroidales bacterium]